MRASLRAHLVTVAPALLALGWFAQSLRAFRAREASSHRALEQRAEVAAAAAREGLEELRAREDERPYEQYSPYYTPPDLIAAQQSLAPSPLARVPLDARVLGHFQLDPDARVSTPLLHTGASPEALARAQSVSAVVRDALAPRLSPLTSRSRVSPNPTNVQTQTAFNNEVLSNILAAQRGDDNRLGAPISPRNRVTNDSVGVAAAAPSDPSTAEYTPMRWVRVDGASALYRVVTTDGASSVQGALLDPEVIVGRWLPAVLARHPSPEARLTVTPHGSSARCDARVRLSPPLDATDVCVTAARPVTDTSLAWQLAALGAVLGVVALAAMARERARQRAEALAKLERAFVASVSHELRTPLTALRMHAEMLHEGWVSEDRKGRVIQQLVDESARLSRLIEDVLTFSRLTDGHPSLRVEPGDLAAHVRSVTERERRRIEAKGVTIQLDTSTEVPARFDRGAVEQMVVNLLENAVKYAPGAPVTVSVSSREGLAVLRVEDKGPGIAKGDRARVFERFFRARDAVSSHVAGTGLGLAIVRGLARSMGGEARVVEASGCAVEIELPQEK